MNAAALLAHYARIAEAPDAVARLRRFVLDLAVRGKLVPQETEDEPASVLLQQVKQEWARLLKAGAVREPTNAVQVRREDSISEVPEHWRWARLIEIAKPAYGFAFSSARFNSERRGMPLIRIRDIASMDTEAYFDGNFESEYIVKTGDYLVGMDGDFNLRRWRGPDALLNQRVMRINGWRCGITSEYVRLPLQFVLDHLHGLTSQTTVKHLSAKQVNGIEIPLPPLAEQHRIVAKVDELMALCDRLEAARTAREATRDRLAAASLARLNTPDLETFPADVRFALDALPALTTRPDQIKQLRQTTLNLAVRGKLVPQDAGDGGWANTADLGQPVEGRLAMPLPLSWRWVSVADVASARLGKMLDAAKNQGAPVPYLGNTNVHWFDIRTADLKTIPLSEEEVEEYRLRAGDVLICEGGHGIGRAAVWPGGDEVVVFQKALHRVRPNAELDSNYFSYCCFVYFDSGIMQTYFTGVGIPHFTGRALAKLSFPLPPLAEQHRIVAKVNALMALCDQLEASLTTASTTRARLLEATLRQALQPAEETLLEAAQ
ncbi:restriction endonuclease subunit S [Belnapia rosea]|uniref:Type I restriction enzyme, S subunit n=1 Tax=Belnapia rosea TaxID=938405 RepID=A0A1G7D7V7_9PROT|nr:restriction endonuclease subunit S [Belnapia rosea]SDE47611.1 type I restriction enzyme, S subunit [Belnapia rosea]